METEPRLVIYIYVYIYIYIYNTDWTLRAL